MVERGSYENLGELMVAASLISFVVPLATIIFVTSRIKLGAAAGANGNGGR